MTDNTTRFIQRRKRLMSQMGGGIALINSAGMTVDPTLHDMNLFYLTGSPSRSAFLLLAPNGARVEWWASRKGSQVGRGEMVSEILFVEEMSEFERDLSGESQDFESIRHETGVERVYGLSQMNGILSEALMAEETLWVNLPAMPDITQPPAPHTVWLNTLIQHFPWVRIRNIALHIHAMRRVKDDYEIHCLRTAYQIKTEIFETIMRRLKPGCNEALGEAIWEYETRLRGNHVASFVNETNQHRLMVAAGRNSVIPHYTSNDAEIQDGDLVLIDGGLAYHGYSADISRTFPANGKFTPRQRHLYEIVLEAQNLAIASMKPGSTQKIAHQVIYEHFKKHNLEEYGFGIYGHAIGLNIHDAISMTRMDRDQPFEPGMVFAVEPFLSIPEEGIGIRIEDGVLITETGSERLVGPPRETREVEAVCSGQSRTSSNIPSPARQTFG